MSYFPLLVAGPIERATHLLPELKVKREFNLDKAKEGIYQIVWGLVKKVVIADRLAIIVDTVYAAPNNYDGIVLITASLFFAFQLRNQLQQSLPVFGFMVKFGELLE